MQHYRVEGNQITLTDGRYYYLDGKFCPSVSTILEAYPKDYGFFKWLKENGEESDKIRDAAGEKGSNVHKMTQSYDEGLEVSLLTTEGRQAWSIAEWAMFDRYVQFREYTKESLIIHGIEMQLINLELMEAGTLDRYIEIGGKHLIMDIKTSNAIYPSYWLQVAAYKRMFERSSGVQIDGVAILWLNAKTRGAAVNKIQGPGWSLLVKEDTTADMVLWEATKTLWLAQNKDVTPKNVSYKLTHKLA